MTQQKKENEAPSSSSPLLLENNFDGIQELDNPLPSWWKALFVLTIIFGIGYYFYYEFGPGKYPSVLLIEDQNEIALKLSKGQPQKDFDEARLNAIAADKAQLTEGKKVFDEKCMVCHGPQGQGTIGPNLTDNFWIHGDGKILSIAQTIKSGVPEKGMPSWGPLLKEEELYRIAAFVSTLKGTNPPNPKAPQGNPTN